MFIQDDNILKISTRLGSCNHLQTPGCKPGLLKMFRFSYRDTNSSTIRSYMPSIFQLTRHIALVYPTILGHALPRSDESRVMKVSENVAPNMVVSPKHCRGMTLVELVVAFAIAGILIAFAAPSLRESIQNNRMVTQINGLHAALSLARAEAVKRRNNVTMCKSNDGTSCSGAWQEGWIIFVDTDHDGSVDGEEVVRTFDGVPAGNSLLFSQTHVIYSNKGNARSGTNGTFTLCDSRGVTHAKGLVIGPSGRPRLAVDSDENGTLNGADELDLVCASQ